MPATMATVDAILKEVYEPSIQEQLNDEVVALRRIERSSEGVDSTVGGKYVVFPIHTARNSGVGARLESEALPVAGNQNFAQARVPLRYQYGRLQLTGQTIELADSNYQAFASAMSEEVTGLKDDVAKDLNRQIYGDGSGAIGAQVVTSGTLASFVVPSVIGFQLGEKIAAGSIAAGVITVTAATVGAVIASINPTTNTITTTGGTGGTAMTGLAVFRADSATANNAQLVAGVANQKEWTGLRKIVASSGVWFNIDPAAAAPATNAGWVSRVDANGGTLRALSEGLMILNTDYVRAAGSRTSVIFCNLGVRRAYFNLLVQQRRFTNTQQFEGGFSGLAFTTDRGEIPVVVDTDCPASTMFGLNEKEMKLYRDNDWSFMSRDGSSFSRIPNVDAYESTLFQYSELGTHRRNAHFVINDLTEA